MKESRCSYKLRYKGYLELICRCLSEDMYTELFHMRIPYREITYVFRKVHVTVVYMILRLEINKSSYIENVML